jgi:uncharacterized protein
MFMRWLVPFSLLLLTPAACSTGAFGGDTATTSAPVPLTIKTATKTLSFKVEVARTSEEQARGLMFRTSLPANGGMIFPMIPPRDASFWMKNTVISLDMIFIRTDGSIARIEPDTIPYSLTPVPSGEPIGAVLELAAGKAAALGIAEGDVVTWNDKSR